MAGRVRVAAVVVGLVLLAGVVACGDDQVESAAPGDQPSTTGPALGGSAGGVRPGPPAGDPSITGPIADVSKVQQTQECDSSEPTGSPDDPVSSDDADAGCAAAAGVLGSFVVREGVDGKGAALAASVTVPSDIAILREDGAGGWTLGSFDDLTQGAKVQVWFDGPVAESYPVQATAGSIVIQA